MVCGAAGNGSRSTNVGGYFWNDTGCRKSAGKRGRAWNNLGIYDVCDDYFIPVTGDVVKSNQKKATCNIYRNCVHGNCHCRIPV